MSIIHAFRGFEKNEVRNPLPALIFWSPCHTFVSFFLNLARTETQLCRLGQNWQSNKLFWPFSPLSGWKINIAKLNVLFMPHSQKRKLNQLFIIVSGRFVNILWADMYTIQLLSMLRVQCPLISLQMSGNFFLSVILAYRTKCPTHLYCLLTRQTSYM